MEPKIILIWHLFLTFACKVNIITSSHTKLIYYDSILSPYYNFTASLSDRANHSILRSKVHFSYLKAAKRKRTEGSLSLVSSNHIQADIIPDGYGYSFLLMFSIGNPPAPQLAIMDTGSSLSWVICGHSDQCDYNNPYTPVYDPYGALYDPWCSISHEAVSCHSADCDDSIQGRCNYFDQCYYYIRYQNGHSEGYLAKDTFRFKNGDVAGMPFGCANKYRGIPTRSSGLIGLGPRNYSLVAKSGNKFSYCIGNISDHEYRFNQLELGEKAVLTGDATSWTPIKLDDDGGYQLTLEAITVGTKRLSLHPEKFTTTASAKTRVIIDTGTTISYLNKDAYDDLEAEVKYIIGNSLLRVTHRLYPNLLCYMGSLLEELEQFRTLAVTFHFANECDLKLYGDSLFFRTGDNEFCMAIAAEDYAADYEDDFSILGVTAQQYHSIAYDFVGMKLHLTRIDCELLQD